MKDGIGKPAERESEKLGDYVLRPAIALTMLDLAERYSEADRATAQERRGANRRGITAGA